ncbi:MAG: LysR family transcriptional regulator [Pseudomonas marincola]
MDWNSLKLFLAISTNRSLVSASHQLGVSHTTAFRHLNAFEKEIGVRLFERIRGDYELTEVGEELLVLAQGISGSFDVINRKIMGQDIQPRGVVKVTAPSSFSYGFLPGYLADFKKQHPDIQVELLVTNQELNMTNRNADIALRIVDSPPDHLVGRHIRSIKWGVFASESYLQEFGTPTCIDDLKNHVLIGATGALQLHPTFSWLEKQLAENISHRCDDWFAMSCLAEAGNGLVIIPDELCKPGLQRCFTFEPGGKNKLWVLTHPDLRKVERIKILMRFLASAFASDDRLV